MTVKLWNKGFLYYIVNDNNIRLNENVAQSEDMLFLLDYVPYCGTLQYDSGVRYGYRQRSESAANSQMKASWFSAVLVYEAYEERLGGDRDLAESIHRAFLPVAYEAKWRYRRCQMSDPRLSSRIEAMCARCEECLSGRTLKYRIKMFAYRHFMGAEMRRRKTVAR